MTREPAEEAVTDALAIIEEGGDVDVATGRASYSAEERDIILRAMRTATQPAADRIEQLEAEIARKDAALNQIAGWAEPNSSIWRVANDARAGASKVEGK